MTVEEELEEFILSRYRSLREFTITNHMPYSTLSTLLRRGVDQTNWKTIVKICDALGISADDLAEGHVVLRGESVSWHDQRMFESYINALRSDEDAQLLFKYHAADPGTQAAVRKLLDIAPPPLPKSWQRDLSGIV